MNLTFSNPPTLDELRAAIEAHEQDLDQLHRLSIRAKLDGLWTDVDGLKARPTGLSVADVDAKIAAARTALEAKIAAIKPGLSAADVDAKIAAAISAARLAPAPATTTTREPIREPAEEDFWGSIEAFFRRYAIQIFFALVVLVAVAVFWPRRPSTTAPPQPPGQTQVTPAPVDPDAETDNLLDQAQKNK